MFSLLSEKVKWVPGKIKTLLKLSFLDRGFVTSTESEKIFMRRFKEILKENKFDV